MVNNNFEHEIDTGELRGAWAGPLIGLLIGGLTGASVMLLMAPQSGKRTRAKLHRQSAVWREQAADTMEDAVASARDKAQQIAHDVGKAA